MQRILIPTDFSTNAYNALRYVKQLFADTTCTFYLLHTYTPAIYRSDYLLESPGQIGLGDVLKFKAEQNLAKTIKKIRKEFPNTKHQLVPHVAFNLLYDEIQKMVTNENIDLIVMGTQGATGAKEIFLGTHAVHAMKKSTIPLLVIPPKADYNKPERILLPTDYEVSLNNNSIKELLSIVEKTGAKVDVLHVSSPDGLNNTQKENRQELSALTSDADTEFHDWPDQELIPAIEKFISEHQSDILVMVRNKHTFFERLFIEPVLKKIAFHTDIPFLVLPINP